MHPFSLAPPSAAKKISLVLCTTVSTASISSPGLERGRPTRVFYSGRGRRGGKGRETIGRFIGNGRFWVIEDIQMDFIDFGYIFLFFGTIENVIVISRIKKERRGSFRSSVNRSKVGRNKRLVKLVKF